VVDTPGTNVIVDRQQRLTEEFVPRSDLVLFIMSSDRPFTESEVCYFAVQQRAKRCAFVLLPTKHYKNSCTQNFLFTKRDSLLDFPAFPS
jgi:hypothetical protein